MRFRHRDGTIVHLAYCTNVHPAEDLDGVLTQLATYAEPVRTRLGWERLGVGLWLAADLAARLRADGPALGRLVAAIEQHGLEVVTLNGFPYGGFHADVVKLAVYQPDWTGPARLQYTADLAWLLARLLPADAPDARGSVSTLPLAWREPWSPERAQAARAQLDQLAKELAAVEDDTGRVIRVGLEPEPGCVVETTADAVRWLAGDGGVDTERIGVCVDTCHLAVAFEQPDEALARLADAGLPVVKVQAATALHAEHPDQPDVRDALAAFAEPRFLHQTRELVRPDADRLSRDDLPDALDGERPLPGRGPWRVHHHLPLHWTPARDDELGSTRAHLDATLAALLAGPTAATDHIEVETYTWTVLPPDRRPAGPAELADGIAAELTSARESLLALGLAEVAA